MFIAHYMLASRRRVTSTDVSVNGAGGRWHPLKRVSLKAHLGWSNRWKQRLWFRGSNVDGACHWPKNLTNHKCFECHLSSKSLPWVYLFSIDIRFQNNALDINVRAVQKQRFWNLKAQVSCRAVAYVVEGRCYRGIYPRDIWRETFTTFVISLLNLTLAFAWSLRKGGSIVRWLRSRGCCTTRRPLSWHDQRQSSQKTRWYTGLHNAEFVVMPGARPKYHCGKFKPLAHAAFIEVMTEEH